MPDTLTIKDNRTGKQYELDITNGTIRATDLRKVKVDENDVGLRTYDPAFMNTAACQSYITFLDGGKGILEYRGIPIEQLAEHSTFLETAYLLLFGELPTEKEMHNWTEQIVQHITLPDDIKQFMKGFRDDAHPMGISLSAVGALSTYYPEAKNIFDEEIRRTQIHRLIAKMPTIAAYSFRTVNGDSYVEPDPSLSFSGNFLRMLFKKDGAPYKINQTLERALDVLFILHADHEQNCSTSTCRMVASGGANPFASVSAAIGALWGPLHGGANMAVIKMLKEIHSSGDDGSRFVEDARNGKARLMGFGHRVYKNYDPRAKILNVSCNSALEALGVASPTLDIARHLEEVALNDDYFIERKLYPNVDFYSGIIYRALGIPTNMFTVLFALGRTPGWLGHWKEIAESGGRIPRPRRHMPPCLGPLSSARRPKRERRG